MEKTIKYLENGEYHYATVKDVGDLAKLKTDSKDDLVAAINDLFENGGKNAGKPEGYDKLVDQMADTIKKQQDISGKLNSAENDLKQKIADSNSSNRTITDELNAQIEVERQKVEALRLAAEQARKELNEQVAKLNADSQELSKKTTDLANDVENKFGSVQNDYKTVSENLTNEAATLHKQLGDVKNEAEATKSRIQDQAEDIGNIHKTVDNVSNQVTQKIWMTDLDPVKQQVTQNSTEVQETQNQLKTKAEQSSLDLVANSVEKLDTEVKKNAEGLEVTVKKEEFAENVAELLKDKTNLLLGTRNFAGDKWSNLDHWHEEPGYWNGLKVYSSDELWFGLQQAYQVIAGNTYTFSFYAKQDKENRSANIVLTEGNLGDTGVVTPYHTNTIVSTDWKRYSLVFRALSDGIIFPRVEQNVEDNRIYVAGYKLELGKNATPWEPNEADVAENIEKNESRFNVFSDQITGLVKKQEKMGDTERQLDTRITETAEGLKQTSKNLEDANGKITEFKGQLESTAKGLKTDYEKYTNEAVGQISDSSLNLIHNSAFSNQDDQFESWQNISAKATVREDSNNLHWVELTQSGQGTDNPIGVTSNYFIVKQGKVTVAVDVKLGDKANLDNQNILLLELYDENKKRVDFTDVSVSALGLSMSTLNDHNVHRGLYRLGIDRKDVKYMTVKAILHRNGDLWLTNFSARLSSIDDGGYTPNPDDLKHQILNQKTKIEQNSQQLILKASSTELRDVRTIANGAVSSANDANNKISAMQNNGGGRNLLVGTGTASGDVVPGNGALINDGFNGYAAIKTNTAWSEYCINLKSALGRTNAKTGDWFTISVYVKADKQINDGYLGVYRALGSVDADTNDGALNGISMQDKPITTQWQQYAWSFQINDISLQRQNTRVEYSQDTGDNWIYWAGWMLEKGTVAHDWTPAPEDTSQEIKSAKDAAIQVASDNVQIKVNELTTSFDDKLNKRVNEVKTASEKFTSDGIEQTVKKITDVQNNVNSKIDNLQIGGRNLVQNGDANDAITPWVNTQFEKHPFYYNGSKRMYNLYTSGKDKVMATNNAWFPVIAGHQYTLSFKGFMSTNVLSYDVWLLGKKANTEVPNGEWSNSCNIINGQRLSAAHTDTVVKTFTVPSDWDNFVVFIRFDNNGSTDGQNSVFFFNEIKLEEGNKASSYTPAPEDIEEKVDTQTLETSDIDAMRAEGHFFVHNLNGNPTSGWVYVDVSGNGLDRIRQDVYQDSNSTVHFHRKLFGNSWTPWEKEATQTDINNLRTETTASVKNLGDRVTTEVNSVTTQMNNKISEINTKLDVANGQIQGKVTETQVNNILNGKGYATQSWAQTMFQMKSDSITLQAVRDNITNGIQNQVNGINNKIDTQTLDSADIDNMRTQGHYFVKNLTGNPISGWVYVDVTGNNNDRIRQDVYADQSYVHKFRSWNGSRWADWEEEVKNTDIISKINMSPEQIKLASNKIEIDGNTYIHGELNVPNVKLNGNNGSIDLSGDGIHIGGPNGDIKLDSGGIDITKNGQGLSITGDYIQVVTDSNGQKEITGLIGSNFNLKNKNQNGLALLVTPQQELGRPYGGDLLTIGELQKNGEVMSAVTFDATNITGDGSGFHWTAPHYLHGPAQAIHIENTQDNLTLLTLKMPHSSQEGYYQPALTVTHGVDGNGNYVHGDSGVEFLWNSIKPYGSVDMTDARLWVYGVDHGIKNVWVSWSGWDGGERYPALVNDIGYWGGIAFPKSGRVTLFDADGRYYTPDRNTGIGAYDNYMSKNNWN